MHPTEQAAVPTRVIGLISGTSVDGIDAALVEISGKELDLQVELVSGATYPYPADLREKILAVCAGEAISMAELAEIDDAIACVFAQAAQNIQIGHQPATLIGSHGQTVYHRPPKAAGEILSKTIPGSSLGYTLQLGRGASWIFFGLYAATRSWCFDCTFDKNYNCE